MTLRVVYVSHTSRVAGAERSLLELISNPPEGVVPVLLCPDGDLRRRADAHGIETRRLPELRLGFGMRFRELPGAGLRLARSAAAVASTARVEKAHAVHAASARAGLIAGLAWLLGAPRPVVDVRDVLPRGTRAGLVRRSLRLSARALVFNSGFTRGRFGPTTPAVGVIAYPAVDIDRLLQLPMADEHRGTRPPTLGVVAQLTPWKGQDDAIRLLELVRRRVPDARLRIIGSVVFKGGSVTLANEAYETSLHDLALKLGVADAVEFAGHIEDPTVVFPSLDVLLVPSWEEPFGRVVAEAMAAGVPVVATSVGGPAELIEHGVSGMLAPPRDPAAWVDAACELLERPERASALAFAARSRIRSLLASREARSVLREVYTHTYTARATVESAGLEEMA